MKHFLIFCSVLLILSSASAQTPFEGVVEMDAKIAQLGDHQIPATFSIKGDQLKLVTDFGMGEASLYFDKPANRVVAVLSAMNMGFELDTKELEQSDAAKADPHPVQLGTTEVINNYTCDHFSCLLDKGFEIDIWATKDMPNSIHKALLHSFSSSIESILRVNTSSIANLINDGYAPVRTVVRKNGKEEIMLTINKVEEQPLDDIIFTVPTNVAIRKIDPSMMGSQED